MSYLTLIRSFDRDLTGWMPMNMSAKNLAVPLAGTALSPRDIVDFCEIARSTTGITLSDRKAEFLSSRLARRLAATGAANYAEYRKILLRSPGEKVFFAEALTTHTTSFFRERAQYDWLLETGFSEFYLEHKRSELVIWSAACSTGQEGYTALMVAQMTRDKGLWNLKAQLIGTDVSRPVVGIATRAVYSKDQVGEIPTDLRHRFLLSAKNRDGRYRIVPELRENATFRVGNLVSGEGIEGISADVIFLRNVLIYFDEETRARVIRNVFQRLRLGGYLMLGHTEAGQARMEGLEAVRPSIYRKVMA